MARKLPPLNSLKSFEAAARRLSFTLAADELCVTQAAISHQVKSLEQFIGSPLFIRLPRNLELTDSGAELLMSLSRCFDDMDATISSLSNKQHKKSLKLRMGSAFAAKWMSPRLPEFTRLHPQAELVFNYSQQLADFERSDIDISITFGDGNWPGLEVYPLIPLDFFPVCSPSFIHDHGTLSHPSQLENFPLLHDLDYYCWSHWLKQVGAEDVNPRRGSVLDDSNVLIQAAVDGQGVAMCSTVLVNDLLATGRLIKPFETVFYSRWAYYLIYTKKNQSNPDILAFRDWLLTHATL
jgi:LysR family glycine cleavage system transcriptional activator